MVRNRNEDSILQIFHLDVPRENFTSTLQDSWIRVK